MHRNYESQGFVFLMINIASGIARGRVHSPTTLPAAVASSRKHGELSHAGLANIKVHISLITLDIHVN